MDPRKASDLSSDPTTLTLHPIAVCENAGVRNRLVVPAAGAVPLLVLDSLVTTLEKVSPTVLMPWSLEADPDQPLTPLWPVKYFLRGLLCLEVLAVAQDARLADLRNVEEKRSASRVVIAASSRLP